MDDFHFSMPYSVHVSDVNYGGHVANSAVLNFFQDARIKFLAELGPYSEMDIGEGRGIVLPEAHVYYQAEMFLHDSLIISVRVSDIKKSSFVLEYRIEREGKVTVEGRTSLVGFNYQLRKASRLPQEFRTALAGFGGE